MRLPRLSRRMVLAGMAGALAGCRPSLSTPSFPLGVASGDASADGALLWTQYTGEDALEVLVWPESDPALAVKQPAPALEGYVVLEIDGLAPGAWHRFRFESADGQLSPEGRFRTALGPDALEVITLGATSCIKVGSSYAALGHAAERSDLDAFIFLATRSTRTAPPPCRTSGASGRRGWRDRSTWRCAAPPR